MVLKPSSRAMSRHRHRGRARACHTRTARERTRSECSDPTKRQRPERSRSVSSDNGPILGATHTVGTKIMRRARGETSLKSAKQKCRNQETIRLPCSEKEFSFRTLLHAYPADANFNRNQIPRTRGSCMRAARACPTTAAQRPLHASCERSSFDSRQKRYEWIERIRGGDPRQEADGLETGIMGGAMTAR